MRLFDVRFPCTWRLGLEYKSMFSHVQLTPSPNIATWIHTGTRPEKIKIQKWYTIYKDHITLSDYEIHDGMGLEMYYH